MTFCETFPRKAASTRAASGPRAANAAAGQRVTVSFGQIVFGQRFRVRAADHVASFVQNTK
jgi:hypothetical protein